MTPVLKSKMRFCGVFLLAWTAAASCSSQSIDTIFSGGFLQPLEIKTVLVIDSNTIQIVFNQPLQPSGLLDRKNYGIYEKEDPAATLPVEDAEVLAGSNNSAVSLKTSAQDVVRYRLTVSGLRTRYGTAQAVKSIARDFVGFNQNAAPVFKVISPLKNERIFTGETFVVWTPDSQADYYQVLIATDADFLNQIQGSPFSVLAPENFLSIQSGLSLPITYYVGIQVNGRPKIEAQTRFHHLDRAVFVSCPQSGHDTNCDGFDDKSGQKVFQVGNQSFPLVSVAAAVRMAAAVPDINEIRIAGRSEVASSSFYPEAVIVPNGVKVFGGYSQDFLSRDPDKYVTTFQGSGGYTLQAFEIDEPTLLDGITFHGPLLPGSSALLSIANTDQLTIRNCKFVVGASDSENYGIYNSGSGTGSPGPVFESIEVSGIATPGISYGLYNAYDNPTLIDSQIRGGESTVAGKISYGIYSTESNIELTNNTIEGGAADFSYGGFFEKSTIVIESNTFAALGSGSVAAGLAFKDDFHSIVRHNKIFANPQADDSIGVDSEFLIPVFFEVSDTFLRVNSNIIFAGSDGVGGTTAFSSHNTIIVNGQYHNNANGISADGAHTANRIYSAGARRRNRGLNVGGNSVLAGNTIQTGPFSPDVSGSTHGHAIRHHGFAFVSITYNTAFSGDGQNSVALLSEVDDFFDPPNISFNMLSTGGGTLRHGIWETSSASDPVQFDRNWIFDAPDGLYREDNGGSGNTCPSGGTDNCYFDGNDTTPVINWHDGVASNPPVGGIAGGNLNRTLTAGQTKDDIFSNNSIALDMTGDGPDENDNYDGTTNSIELPDCQSGLYIVGEFFEYNSDRVAREIVSVDCSSTTAVIHFTPVLSEPSEKYQLITLWGANNNQDSYHSDHRLVAGSPPIKTGGCGKLSESTFIWLEAFSQSDCDTYFPGSYFNFIDCRSYYLEAAVELLDDGIGNENGLCESSEQCLFYSNVGSYAGHGNLVPANSVVTDTLECPDIGTGGNVENVTLFKYHLNGD